MKCTNDDPHIGGNAPVSFSDEGLPHAPTHGARVLSSKPLFKASRGVPVDTKVIESPFSGAKVERKQQ